MIETFVIGLGLFTLTVVAGCLVYFSIILTLHYTFAQRNALKILAKYFWNFYTTLPDTHHRRFPKIACIFDRNTGEFTIIERMTEGYETEEEVEEKFEELRKSLLKKKE